MEEDRDRRNYPIDLLARDITADVIMLWRKANDLFQPPVITITNFDGPGPKFNTMKPNSQNKIWPVLESRNQGNQDAIPIYRALGNFDVKSSGNAPSRLP